MPVHDWTRVNPGIFHDFHTVWIGQIRTALNSGILPASCYALAEQHAGAGIADVLTLHSGHAEESSELFNSVGTAVAEAPPRVRGRWTASLSVAQRPRTIAIRHTSGHRLIAMLEIVSPANKDRLASVDAFAAKAVEALQADVHLLVVDLFPPGRHDPFGMSAAIRQHLEQLDTPQIDAARPKAEPLTLAAYDAGPPIELYLEFLRPGAAIPQMPLFLRPNRYVNVPLEETYLAAYSGLPSYWREVLEGKRRAD